MENLSDTERHMLPLVYTPVYRPNNPGTEHLIRNANGDNSRIGRMVLCAEASVLRDHRQQAQDNAETVFAGIKPDSPVEVYYRAPDFDGFQRILETPNVERLSGFVVAKAGLGHKGEEDFAKYSRLLNSIPGHDFSLQPILESNGFRKPGYRQDLFDLFDDPEQRKNILMLRLGIKDLERYTGVSRNPKQTIYGNSAMRHLINCYVTEFGGEGGFQLAAPVDECYGKQHADVFRKGVRKDMSLGLFSKTVIHTDQIPWVLEESKVSSKKLERARRILDPSIPAVVNLGDGRMAEREADIPGALVTVARANAFGIRRKPSSDRQEVEAA